MIDWQSLFVSRTSDTIRLEISAPSLTSSAKLRTANRLFIYCITFEHFKSMRSWISCRAVAFPVFIISHDQSLKCNVFRPEYDKFTSFSVYSCSWLFQYLNQQVFWNDQRYNSHTQFIHTKMLYENGLFTTIHLFNLLINLLRASICTFLHLHFCSLHAHLLSCWLL